MGRRGPPGLLFIRAVFRSRPRKLLICQARIAMGISPHQQGRSEHIVIACSGLNASAEQDLWAFSQWLDLLTAMMILSFMLREF